MFDEAQRHLSNEASVLGRTLAHAPGAMMDEVLDDWNNHGKDLALRTGESAVFGLGTGIALAKVPGIAKAGLAGLAAYGVVRGLSGIGSVVSGAWDADTEEQRKAVIADSTLRLGRDGASALETSVGFGLGGGLGIGLSSRISALEGISTRVGRGVAAGSDRLMFGPGVERLPGGLLNADKSINLVGLSEELAGRHTWNGVEVARSIRLTDLKAGPALEGDLASVRPFGEGQFKARPGRMDFHMHPPELETSSYKVMGARPSEGDVLFTDGTGMIRSGSATTVYRGLNSEMLAAIRDGKPFSAQLDAVVYDPSTRLAVQLKNSQNPLTRRWEPSVPRFLDYDATVQLLSRWNHDWSSVESVPTVSTSTALLHPSGASLLKLGVYNPEMAASTASR